MASSGAKRRRSEAAAAPPPEPAAPAALAADDACTVFVSGIPYDATDESIRGFFSGCGDIAEVRAPRFNDSGRLMGYAHVQFASSDSLEAALARDGAYLGERFLTVEASRPVAEGPSTSLAQSQKAQPKGCATIFVKGVPYESDEAALAAVFARFGTVVSTRLPRWAHTGKRKGHAYVQFSAAPAAAAAVAAYRAAAGTSAALRVGERLVHLDYDDGAPKASFKTESGRAFYKTAEGEKASEKEKAGEGAAAGGGGHYWPRAKKGGGSGAGGGAAASAPPPAAAAPSASGGGERPPKPLKKARPAKGGKGGAGE